MIKEAAILLGLMLGTAIGLDLLERLLFGY